MTIKKMGLSWIVVADAARSKKFFTETLGLKLTSDAPEFGWMEVSPQGEAESCLGIGQYSPEHGDVKPGQNAVATFVVDDIIAKKKELEGKGVKFVDEIMEVPGHVKMVSFVDPDNNMFQLVQILGK